MPDYALPGHYLNRSKRNNWLQRKQNPRLASPNAALAATNYALVLDVNALTNDGDQPAINEKTKIIYDFCVTGNSIQLSYELLRFVKSFKHSELDLTLDLTRDCVSETRDGKTTVHSFDETDPSLQDILVDLFDYPLFCSTQLSDGSQLIENSTRKGAQKEIENGTPLMLSLLPLSNQQIQLLPQEPTHQLQCVFLLNRGLTIEPTMKLSGDFCLRLLPDLWRRDIYRYVIQGAARLDAPEFTNRPVITLSPIKGHLEFDKTTGNLISGAMSFEMASINKFDTSSVVKYDLSVAPLNRITNEQ